MLLDSPVAQSLACTVKGGDPCGCALPQRPLPSPLKSPHTCSREAPAGYPVVDGNLRALFSRHGSVKGRAEALHR